MMDRVPSFLEARFFEISASYFRGLVILSAVALGAAFTYRALSSTFASYAGVDLAQQAPWFEPVFQVVATALVCVFSTYAVNKMLGKEKQFLWYWPAVVFCFSLILTAFMGSAWSFAEDVQRTGAVVLGVVVMLRLRDEK